ncbi:hypothetical protein SAMN05444166_8423 [Singulisphaera sp. GP187]|nr:hypothetical protein SAMN05444166_8423 [Singulisphaera sp. GP187]
MITSRRELRGTTLGLALLLAFPWQLALSAVECSTQTIAVGAQGRFDEATQHLQMSGDASARTPWDCLTISMVIGEPEPEGDDACAFAFDLIAFPAYGCSMSVESAAVPTMISTQRSSPPLTQPLCLRC